MDRSEGRSGSFLFFCYLFLISYYMGVGRCASKVPSKLWYRRPVHRRPVQEVDLFSCMGSHSEKEELQSGLGRKGG